MIPKEIKIFHQIYQIEIDNDYLNKKGEDGSLGEADCNLNIIRLASLHMGEVVPVGKVFRILCHEIAHVMLAESGKDELYLNEELVDRLSLALESFLIKNTTWHEDVPIYQLSALGEVIP